MSIKTKNYMEDGYLEGVAKMMKFPAADRNKTAIFDVICKFFPQADGSVKSGESESSENNKIRAFEVSSGTGQHVYYFAKHSPRVLWQPSEYDPKFAKSIQAYINYYGLTNVLPPVLVDIREPVDSWLPETLSRNSCDFILNVNLVHISPWACAVGLMSAAGQLLKEGGLLFLYGPMAVHGVITPESNVLFDRSLRAQDPSWGLRDLDDLEKEANKNGLFIKEVVDMPANNKTVVFEKRKVSE